MAKRTPKTPVPADAEPVVTDDTDNGSSALRNDRLIMALIEKRTVAEAAQAAGLSISATYARLKDPDFSAQLKAARRAREEHGLARLSDLTSAAVVTLGEVLDADTAAKQGAGVRVQAARAILDFIHRERGDDVRDQIEELRAVVEDLKAQEKNR